MADVTDIKEARERKQTRPFIRIVDGPHLVSNTGTKVVIEGMIRASCPYCKKTMLSLDGTFDFAKIPPSLHGMFLNLLLQRSAHFVNLIGHTEGTCVPREKPKLVHSSKEDPKWWVRLLGWFRRIFSLQSFGIRK